MKKLMSLKLTGPISCACACPNRFQRNNKHTNFSNTQFHFQTNKTN